MWHYLLKQWKQCFLYTYEFITTTTTWFSYLQADISCLSIFDYLWYEEATAELQPTSNTQTQTSGCVRSRRTSFNFLLMTKEGQNSGMVSVHYLVTIITQMYIIKCIFIIFPLFSEKDKRHNERKQNPVHCCPISAVHQTRLNSAPLSVLITLFLCHVWLSMRENNYSLWRWERCCHSTSSAHFQCPLSLCLYRSAIHAQKHLYTSQKHHNPINPFLIASLSSVFLVSSLTWISWAWAGRTATWCFRGIRGLMASNSGRRLGSFITSFRSPTRTGISMDL